MTVQNLAVADLLLPPRIVIDTNILIASFNRTETSTWIATQYERAHTFFGLLDQQNRQGYVTSTSVGEFLHWVVRVRFEADLPRFAALLRESFPRKLRFRWDDLYKLQPRLLSSYRPDLDAAIQFMESLRLYPLQSNDLHIPVGETNESALAEIMERFALCVNDAAILLEARRADILNVVTMDRDLLRASEDFNIYTWS